MSLQVLVNITLTYAIRENKIYEQCKGLIEYNFEQNNFQVTAPFRQSFSPLGCPTISTNNGAVLVDEEYFCTTGKKIKFQPEGYTSPIDVCGKMLSFPLHGAFQLSMIGILNLGCSMASSPSLLFVFLHSFVFQLVLRFSAGALPASSAALCSPSWTSRRVCRVQLPLLFLVQPYSCQPPASGGQAREEEGGKEVACHPSSHPQADLQLYTTELVHHAKTALLFTQVQACTTSKQL